MAADKYACNLCHKAVAVTTRNKYRKHDNPETGDDCLMTGKSVPAIQLDKGPLTPEELKQPDRPVYGRDMASCGACGRKLVALAEDGRLKQHSSKQGVWSPCDNREPTIDTELSAPAASPAVPVSAVIESSSGSTPVSSARSRWAQPAAAPSRFAQPGKLPRASGSTLPMSEFSQQLLTSMKEMFFHYNNRQTSDNRSAQTTLGPSEIGSPCDRRIVMSLLGVQPVAPGGDGFAAWLGTQAHAGVAEMLSWADGRSGRYAVEVPLLFPSAHVPRGTSDALDRVLRVAIDHKFMGTYSLRKLKEKGPSDTYRVQVHTYAYGQQLRGEKVDMVAIIGWPRQGSSLDDLYVWSEPYDPSVAIKALGRVQRLAVAAEADADWRKAAIADDCRYCPFYLPGGDNSYACNGKE